MGLIAPQNLGTKDCWITSELSLMLSEDFLFCRLAKEGGCPSPAGGRCRSGGARTDPAMVRMSHEALSRPVVRTT